MKRVSSGDDVESAPVDRRAPAPRRDRVEALQGASGVIPQVLVEEDHVDALRTERIPVGVGRRHALVVVEHGQSAKRSHAPNLAARVE